MPARPHRAVVTLATTALAGATALAGPAAAAPPERTYEVTITNLTTGQPFTPELVVTHRASVDLVEVGEPASTGVAEIAENGDLGPLMAAVTGAPGVSGVHVGAAPLVPAGLPGSGAFKDSVSVQLTAGPGATRLSWVAMLICTNDGFTAVDSLKLPNRIGSSTSITTEAYDAGTEVNTENLSDIVPPCQGLVGITGDPGTGTSDPALAEGGVVADHPGIAGVADLLPKVHGWDGPVATVTVTRVG